MLREELHRIAKQKRRIVVSGSQYELRGSIYESFGEDAFQVQLRRVEPGASADRAHGRLSRRTR